MGGMSVEDGRQADERVDESKRVQHEFLVLVVLCLVVGGGFLATRAASRANDRLRLRDAAIWFERGSNDLAAGLARDSIAALRRSTALDRDNRRYRLELARALVTNREDVPARQVLVGLRELAPEDPEVNLQLARLEKRQGNFSEATRHYSSALYGQWGDGRDAEHRKVRSEFVRYLLAHGRTDRALSELLILDANVPDDLAPHLEAGELFMSAGDPRRALAHFRRALIFDSESVRALGGAGEAAFAVGDYQLSRRLLAHAFDPTDARSTRLRELGEIANLVVERDPLRRRLSTGDRRSRLGAALSRAKERLDSCLHGSAASTQPHRGTLEGLYAEIAAFQIPQARKIVMEDIEGGLSAVYRVELETAACGPPSALDRALLLITQRHEIDQR